MTKRLTKAEEEIMLILWKLGESTIRDVMNELNEPETPYTTVSTVVRVLEKKEICGSQSCGNHLPVLSRWYQKKTTSGDTCRGLYPTISMVPFPEWQPFLPKKMIWIWVNCRN